MACRSSLRRYGLRAPTRLVGRTERSELRQTEQFPHNRRTECLPQQPWNCKQSKNQRSKNCLLKTSPTGSKRGTRWLAVARCARYGLRAPTRFVGRTERSELRQTEQFPHNRRTECLPQQPWNCKQSKNQRSKNCLSKASSTGLKRGTRWLAVARCARYGLLAPTSQRPIQISCVPTSSAKHSSKKLT